MNLDGDDEYFDVNGYSSKFGPSQIPGDWRGTHEELLRHIRRQRRAAKAKKREEELKSDLGQYSIYVVKILKNRVPPMYNVNCRDKIQNLVQFQNYSFFLNQKR